MNRLIPILVLLSGCSMLYEEADDDFNDGFCGDGIGDIGESCDDGNEDIADGCTPSCDIEYRRTVRWVFFPSVNGPAEEDGICRASVRQVELATDRTGYPTRTTICEGRMATIFVPQGAHVVARLRDAADLIVAESIPVETDVASFYEDAGYVHASWAWRDAQGNMIDCPANAPANELSLTPQAGGPTISQTFPCVSRGVRYSAPVLEGTYTAKLTSFRGEQTAVGVIVRNNNRVTELAFDP